MPSGLAGKTVPLEHPYVRSIPCAMLCRIAHAVSHQTQSPSNPAFFDLEHPKRLMRAVAIGYLRWPGKR